MDKVNRFSKQPLRGKNWTDEETRLFIMVLADYSPKLQGRGRKARVFDRIACHLREHYSVNRSSKEVQNKYKSMLKEYRRAVSSIAKSRCSNPSNYKWFTQLDAFMKTSITNHNETFGCNTKEASNLTPPSSNIEEKEVRQNEHSENSRVNSPATASCAERINNEIFDLTSPAKESEALESYISRKVDLHGASSSSSSNILPAKKRKVTFEGSEMDAPSCAWRLIKDELKEHTKNAVQVQERICDSLNNFNQMIQSLNGALTMIPNLIGQILQCQTNQFSNSSQQNGQVNHVILSPLAQSAPQQLPQSTSTQYVWLLDPTAVCGNKTALPGP